jgi:hypothetical protein
VWNTLSRDHQQKIRNAFYLIHGKQGVTTADILNWWRELSREEQRDITDPTPLPENTDSEPESPEEVAPSSLQDPFVSTSAAPVDQPIIASGYFPDHPRPRHNFDARKMWHIIITVVLATISVPVSAFEWGDTFESLAKSVGTESALAQGAAWFPAVAGLTTLVALRKLHDAWQKHNTPARSTDQNEVAGVYGWAKQADIALSDAIHEIEQLEKKLDKALLEKDQAIRDPAIDKVKKGLNNLDGRFRGIEHLPEVKKALAHIEQMRKVASGKAPEDLDFSDHPEKDEVLRFARPSGRWENPFPAPFRRDEKSDNVPDPDKMDYTFTTPTAPTSDRWLEVSKPFDFDGNPKNWRPWRTAVETYVSDNLSRFRSGLSVMDVVNASILPNTRAKLLMTALLQSIFTDGTEERREFESLKQTFQVFRWTMNKLEPHFRDALSSAEAMNQLRHQQRNEPLSEWLAKLDMARLTLGMSHDHALAFLLTGINKELAILIATKVGKVYTQLVWAEIEQWGPPCEDELKLIHQQHKAHNPAPRAPSAPRASSSSSSSAPAHHAPSPSGGCKKRWDDSPPVPSWLRGKLADNPKIKEHCKKHNLCFRCRRPAADHVGGRFSGPSSVASRVSSTEADDPVFGPPIDSDQ